MVNGTNVNTQNINANMSASQNQRHQRHASNNQGPMNDHYMNNPSGVSFAQFSSQAQKKPSTSTNIINFGSTGVSIAREIQGKQKQTTADQLYIEKRRPSGKGGKADSHPASTVQSPDMKGGRYSLKFDGVFIGNQTQKINQAQFMGGQGTHTGNFMDSSENPMSHKTLEDAAGTRGATNYPSKSLGRDGMRPGTGSKNLQKQVGMYSANVTPKNAILTINQQRPS